MPEAKPKVAERQSAGVLKANIRVRVIGSSCQMTRILKRLDTLAERNSLHRKQRPRLGR
jgi:hypothetical protein